MTPDRQYYYEDKDKLLYQIAPKLFLRGDRYHLRNAIIILNRKW